MILEESAVVTKNIKSFNNMKYVFQNTTRSGIMSKVSNNWINLDTRIRNDTRIVYFSSYYYKPEAIKKRTIFKYIPHRIRYMASPYHRPENHRIFKENY